MKKYIPITLSLFLSLNGCKDDKNFATLEDMPKYHYGIYDSNKNKKPDINDSFFLSEDTNLDGLMDKAYLHKIGIYDSIFERKYSIESVSFRVLDDSDYDGVYDTFNNKEVNNSDKIMSSFKENGYNPKRIKIN